MVVAGQTASARKHRDVYYFSLVGGHLGDLVYMIEFLYYDFDREPDLHLHHMNCHCTHYLSLQQFTV